MLNRSLHRWISLPIAIFMLWIGATGVILQIQQLGGHEDGHVGAAHHAAPADVDVAAAVAKGLAAARALDPQFHTRTVQVDLGGSALHVLIGARARGGDQIDYDAGTGTATKVVQKMSLHGLIIHLHSGEAIGPVGTVIGLIAGIALVVLSVTGAVVYIDMYRRRARAGKGGLFWHR